MCRFIAVCMLVVLLVSTGSVVRAQSGGSIQFGETVTGDLQSAAGDRWTFSGAAGEIVDIRLDSADFDPALELIAPDGSSLDTDDDGGVGLNAEIRVMLPADGEYTILARGFGGGSGAYSLSLDDIEPPQEQDRMLAYGDTVESYLTLGVLEEERWEFQGTQGDLVMIHTYSMGLLPTIHITAGEGFFDVCRRELVLELPATGVYTIYVEASFPSPGVNTGFYTLSLDRYAAPPMPERLEYGTHLEFFVTSDDSEGQWAFHGAAGDVVRLLCRVGTMPHTMVVTDPQGRDVQASDIDYGLYWLPETGDYTISAQYDDIRSMLYSITLDHLVEQPIEPEQIVTNRIWHSQNGKHLPGLWTFSAQANDVIVVESLGNFFMPIIYLYNSAGRQVAMPEMQYWGWMALAYRVPEAGEYDLTAADEGQLLLHLIRERTSDQIAYGDRVMSALDSVETERWYFSGEAGDIINVGVGSVSIPMDLVLEDAEGDVLHEATYHSTLFNRSAMFYTLPADGEYTVVVSSPSYVELAGDYVLRLDRVDAEPIEAGQTVMRTFAGTGVWVFTGQEGDLARIHLTAIGPVPELAVYALDGTPLVRELEEPDISRHLPADGMYLIVVRSQYPTLRDEDYPPARYTLSLEIEGD
jgi:hypothetical protein